MSKGSRLISGTILLATVAPAALCFAALFRGYVAKQPYVIHLGNASSALVLDGGAAYLLTGDFAHRIELEDMRKMLRTRTRVNRGLTNAKIATHAKSVFARLRSKRKIFGLWHETPLRPTLSRSTAKYRRFSILGISAALSTLPLGLFVARRLRPARRRRRRMALNQCVNCAYDLTGLPEPRCPECGTPFDQSRSNPENRIRSRPRAAVISGLAISLSIIIVALVSVGRVIVFNTGQPELAFGEYDYGSWGGVEILFRGGLLEVRHRPTVPAQWADSIIKMERTLIGRGGDSNHPSSGWASYDMPEPQFRFWPSGGVVQHRLLPALPSRRTALVIRFPLWIIFLLFAIPTSCLWQRGRCAVKSCEHEPMEPEGDAP